MGSGAAARHPPAPAARTLSLSLLVLVLFLLAALCPVHSAPAALDLVLNITRIDGGDVFFITEDECGVTRCGEISGGTALSSRPPGASGPCACNCPPSQPLFREDQLSCASDITECPVAEFGSGDGASKVPMVFLPLNGQIIHPSKEINFPDIENAVCAVSSAQFLTNAGWSSLREEKDNDVPFSLYRDEGKTFLMWRGSEGSRERLTGRAVLVRLACWVGTRLLLPCAAFRVSGTSLDARNDMTEVFFSFGAAPSETDRASWATGPGMGAPLLLCALVATLLYAGALLMYLRAKRRMLLPRAALKLDDDSELDMPNTKTNPLLSLDGFLTESRRSSCEVPSDKDDSISGAYSSQSSSRTDSLNDRTKDGDDRAAEEIESFDELKTCTTAATVHRLAVASLHPGSLLITQQALVERRPELHVAILDEAENTKVERIPVVPPPGNIRKKLYFNPAFLEPQMLKIPPPAAVEFLIKIREVITIATEKMKTKRFVQILPTITEEHSCHSIEINLSDDFNTKYTALSLKRENSRRRSYCSGCPGCMSTKFNKVYLKTLSEKKYCKSCISGNLKQNIVKKWLDDVPSTESSEVDSYRLPNKSVSKIHGTPKSIEPPNKLDKNNGIKTRVEVEINIGNSVTKNKVGVEINNGKTVLEKTNLTKSRKKMPPPPAPPQRLSSVHSDTSQLPKEQESLDKTSSELKKKDEDTVVILIPPELKQKMNAVINELSKFRRVDPILPRIPSPVSEVVTPFLPKLVIPITPKVIMPDYSKNESNAPPFAKLSEDGQIKTRLQFLGYKGHFEADSLERSGSKRRASLSNLDFVEVRPESHRSHKRRSSIIAMEELEPMKKIYEMNSRLSRSYQGIDSTSDALENINKRILEEDNTKINCKSYAIQRTNLVSEVYINDYVNTMSSASDSDMSVSNKSVKIKYAEPESRPGQLVIEVDNPIERRMDKICDDFDADTLDRKPEKFKIQGNIQLNYREPNSKSIDKFSLKSTGTFKTKSLTGFEDCVNEKGFTQSFLDLRNNRPSHEVISNLTYKSVPYSKSSSSTYSTFSGKPDGNYENYVVNPERTNTKSLRSLSEIFLERKEEVKPSLPLKTVVGKRNNCLWNTQNTYRVHLPSRNHQNSNYNNNKAINTAGMNFRITRSEPPLKNNNSTEDIQYFSKTHLSKPKQTIRNYTTFASLDYSYNRPEETIYTPSDPNYENYSKYDEVYESKSFRSTEEAEDSVRKGIKQPKDRDSNFSMKRPLRRSTRTRQKRVQQTKHHKTEDSGYLSSDSNESRQKSRFVLQVRETAKETVTDTDDLESLGDARSESGGESIETNSVFFGSFRRVSALKRLQEKMGKEDYSEYCNDSLARTDEEKELRSVISIISPRGRLAALDDL